MENKIKQVLNLLKGENTNDAHNILNQCIFNLKSASTLDSVDELEIRYSARLFS
jgi:hypothetical protein